MSIISAEKNVVFRELRTLCRKAGEAMPEDEAASITPRLRAKSDANSGAADAASTPNVAPAIAVASLDEEPAVAAAPELVADVADALEGRWPQCAHPPAP